MARTRQAARGSGTGKRQPLSSQERLQQQRLQGGHCCQICANGHDSLDHGVIERLWSHMGYENSTTSRTDDSNYCNEDDESEATPNEWTGLHEFQTKNLLLCSRCAFTHQNGAEPPTRSLQGPETEDAWLTGTLHRMNVATYDSSERYWPRLSNVESVVSLVGDYDLLFAGTCKRSDGINRIQRAGRFGKISVRAFDDNKADDAGSDDDSDDAAAKFSFTFDITDSAFSTGFDPEMFESNEGSWTTHMVFQQQGRAAFCDDSSLGAWFCVWNGGGHVQFRRAEEISAFPWIPNDWEVATSRYTKDAIGLQRDHEKQSRLGLRRQSLPVETRNHIVHFSSCRPQPAFEVLPEDLWITFRGDDTVNDYNGLLIARKAGK